MKAKLVKCFYDTHFWPGYEDSLILSISYIADMILNNSIILYLLTKNTSRKLQHKQNKYVLKLA